MLRPEKTGGTMTNQHAATVNGRLALWAERKQDFLMVSAFGMWAVILGLSPVLLFRALSVG